MLEPGSLIDGKYRIVGVVGKGGMGTVYEGQNVRIDRRVAIKTMHASIAQDKQLVARFEREAQAAARIGSNHIVDVLDLGDLSNGDRFMVMEFLDGETLLERVKRSERLSPKEVAPIAMQMLDGLARVHAAGIVHRDLKPGNIFLVRTERGEDFVKILDFGVCKFLANNGEPTGLGKLLGTLQYMAPEHLEHGSRDLDGRSDLYSLGVILYRCVAGRLPYNARNLALLHQQMREGRPPSLRELVEDVDKGFAAIVDRAIEWDPKARFASAAEFNKALTDWTNRVCRVERILSDFLDVEAPTSAPRSEPMTLKMQAPKPVEPVPDPTLGPDTLPDACGGQVAAMAGGSNVDGPLQTEELSIDVEVELNSDPAFSDS